MAVDERCQVGVLATLVVVGVAQQQGVAGDVEAEVDGSVVAVCVSHFKQMYLYGPVFARVSHVCAAVANGVDGCELPQSVEVAIV